MKSVIINGDDFGLTKGCTDGIIKAMKEGVVTSATVMINMPYAFKSIEIGKKKGIKELGLHLNLTCGKPITSISNIASLVDESGRFYKRRNQLFPKIKLEEAKVELENQIKTFLNTGIQLTHFDSHHHIHMYDGIREIVGDLAKKYDVSLRSPNEETKKYLLSNGIKTTDYFSMDFYGEKANFDNLKAIIEGFPDGLIEIMTHPAFVDKELSKFSSYNTYRESELMVLTSDALIKWLDEKSINLVTYKGLRD